MDLVTQATIGAVAALCVAPKKLTVRAAITGALAGMAPDLDTLLGAGSDPLQTLEVHRHFTHSLAFIPFGASIVTLVLWLGSLRRWTWHSIWWFALLGFATHGVLDACTSFGTHLLWPFSSERTAWNIVSVLDPVLSVPLVGLCITAVRQKRRRPAQLGLTWALLYLFLCFHQHNIAVTEQESLAASRGHNPQRAVIKPSFGNNQLFRSVYEHEGIFYVDAIRIGWFSIPHIFTGSGIAKLDIENVYPELSVPSKQKQSIDRFRHLTNDFLVLHPGEDYLLGDIRYALVPGSIRPLWGIRVNPDAPDSELEFVHMRKPLPGELSLFMTMLFDLDS